MDDSVIDSYVRAGNIAREIKKFVENFVKKDMKLIDIALAIDDKIAKFGATPAFPVNLSIDEVAAHFTPDLSCEKKAGGLLKVDIGVCVDGYIADTAISIDLTGGEHKHLLEANRLVLSNVEKIVKPKMKLNEVGIAVEEALLKFNSDNGTNFSIVRGLCGHSLGKDTIHAGITIPNYKNPSETILDEIAFAVEPFLTYGRGEIYEGAGGGIFALSKVGAKVRDSYSREILAFIEENYKTRPFCTRWLEKAGFRKLRFVLSIFEKQGILKQYPLLIEKTKSAVSQFENTFLIANENVLITTR